MDKGSAIAKKKRASRPKARSGCGTCKIRHVRCDEFKPICNNCKNTGRICDGYIDPQTKTRVGGHQFSQRTPSSRGPMAIRPRTTISENDSEHFAFACFRETTAVQLIWALQSDIYIQPILQYCHEDTAIRHCVMALGCFSKEIQMRFPDGMQRTLDPDQESRAERLLSVALRYYGKGLSELRSSLFTGNGSRTPLQTILCCVLFAVCECTRGNTEDFWPHLMAGTQLLNMVYSQGGFKPHEREFAEQLGRFLVIIDLCVAVWLDKDSCVLHKQVGFELLSTSLYPTTAEDLEKASYEIISISNSVRSLRQAVIASGLQELTAQARDECNSSFRTKQAALSSLVEAWRARWHPDWYDPSDQWRSLAWRRRVGENYCTYLMTVIRVQACLLSDPTKLFDKNEDKFREIVRVVRVFININASDRRASSAEAPLNPRMRTLQASDRTNSETSLASSSTGGVESGSSNPRVSELSEKPIKPRPLPPRSETLGRPTEATDDLIPIFSFISRFIYPLFFVARRCQAATVRDEALRLLTNRPWREGAFNSLTMARFANMLNTREETNNRNSQ